MKPVVRNYLVYTLKGQWLGPVLAEDARQAVRIAATLSDSWAKGLVRIVKVEASGELLEVPDRD